MRIFSAVFSIVLLAVLNPALAQSSSDEWQFQVTPYLWLPTIDGNLNYSPPSGGGGGGPDISVGPTQWLDFLNIGILVNGSARKGRFSVSADLVYLSMTKNGDARVLSVDGNLPAGPITIPVSAELNLNTRSDLDGLTWTLVGGYTVKETETSLVDLVAGVRYFNVNVSTSWDLSAAITTPGGTELLAQQGRIESDTELWDGVVGVRGRFALGEEKKWSAPFYFDIGAGSSDLTWSATLGLARNYGWGDLLLVYRHLDYDEGSSGLMQGFSFSGPAFGARFRF